MLDAFGLVFGMSVSGCVGDPVARIGFGMQRTREGVGPTELAEQRQQEQARDASDAGAPGHADAGRPRRSATSAISRTSAAVGSGCATAYTTGVSAQRVSVRSASCSAMSAATGGETS